MGVARAVVLAVGAGVLFLGFFYALYARSHRDQFTAEPTA
jgi:hypothetical protein